MSRPNSPIKPISSDEETIKKLKAILIKEKRINKENEKNISDLNEEIIRKDEENALLIDQIKRLSENLSINDDCSALKIENEELKLVVDTYKSDLYNYSKDVSKSLSKMSKKEIIIDANNSLKETLSKTLDLLIDCNKQLESKSVLEDGLDVLSNKCYDLEDKLNNKDQQIHSLEEIIENSRNISRALEKERDQLQIELVDLRQRQEEKEAYLEEEYREIARTYQNYQTNSTNETEQLKKRLDNALNKTMEDKECYCDNYSEELSNLKQELKSKTFENVDFMKKVQEILDFCENNINKDVTFHKIQSLTGRLDALNEQILVKCKVNKNFNSKFDKLLRSCGINNAKNNLNACDLIQRKFDRFEEENKDFIGFLQDLNDTYSLELKILSCDNVLEGLKVKWNSFNWKNMKIVQKIVKEFQIDPDYMDLDKIFRVILNKYEEMCGKMDLQLENKEILLEIIDEFQIDKNTINLDCVFEVILNKYREVCSEMDIKSSQNEKIHELSGAMEYKLKNAVNIDGEFEELLNKLLENYQESQDKLIKSIEFNGNMEKRIKELFGRLTELETMSEEKWENYNEDLVTMEEILSNIRNILNVETDYQIILRINDLVEENKVIKESVVLERNALLAEYENTVDQLKKELERSGRNQNKSDLMNLELEEVNKTLQNLKNSVSTKSEKIEQLEKNLTKSDDELRQCLDKINKLERANKKLEGRDEKMKSLLVKSKKELADCKSELTNTKSKADESFMELELKMRELEDFKLNSMETLVDRETVLSRLKEKNQKLESLIKSKDNKCATLKFELNNESNKLARLTKEFDAYKNKVQTVFNSQSKSKSILSNFMTSDLTDNQTDLIINMNQKSNIEDIQLTSSNNRIQELEIALEEMKLELNSMEENSFSLTKEVGELRKDNEKWIEKYKHVLKEKNEVMEKLQNKIQNMHEESKLKLSTQTQLVERLTDEKSGMSENYEDIIRKCKINYENLIEELKQKVEQLTFDKTQIDQECWDLRKHIKNIEMKYNNYPLTDIAGSDQFRNSRLLSWTANLNSGASPIYPERQQGEGMEAGQDLDSSNLDNIVSPPVHKKKSKPAFVPLEQLLSPPSEKDTNSDINLENKTPLNFPKLREEFLKELKKSEFQLKQQVLDLTDQLNDSETIVTRLDEQNKILKSEIRRLENNEERERKLADQKSCEYLKNVLIKFLDYDNVDVNEREQLVPVLVMILSLDSGEKGVLIRSIARSILPPTTGDNTDNANHADLHNNSDAWVNYFNWTGLT